MENKHSKQLGHGAAIKIASSYSYSGNFDSILLDLVLIPVVFEFVIFSDNAQHCGYVTLNYIQRVSKVMIHNLKVKNAN